MGAAATFWNQDNQIDQILVNIEPHHPSSTKAELIAILYSLKKCNSNQLVKVYTDSQAAIDAITAFSQISNIKSKIRLKNFEILEDILNLIQKYDHIPSFVKVMDIVTYPKMIK